MDKTQVQLRRSAKADIRTCHMELMKMAMEDDDLADVWPEFRSGLSAKTTKQYTYANLIVQHQRMMHDLGFFSDDDIQAYFHYLFTNPTMRGFWEARMIARQVIMQPGNAEWTFDQLIDHAYSDMRLADSIPAQSERAVDMVDLDPRSDAA